MRSLLLVPDGVSIRNFVLGRTASLLAEAGELVVWADPALPEVDDDPHGATWTWDLLAAYPERPVEATLRRTLEYAHLRALDTPGSRFVLAQPIPGRRRSQALRYVARSASKPFGTTAGVQRLVRRHDAMADRRAEVDVATAAAGRAAARRGAVRAPASAGRAAGDPRRPPAGHPHRHLRLQLGQPDDEGAHGRAVRPLPGLVRAHGGRAGPLLPRRHRRSRARGRHTAVRSLCRPRPPFQPGGAGRVARPRSVPTDRLLHGRGRRHLSRRPLPPRRAARSGAGRPRPG